MVKQSELLKNLLILNENNEEKNIYEVCNFYSDGYNDPINILYLESLEFLKDLKNNVYHDLKIVGQEATFNSNKNEYESYFKDVNFKNTFKVEQKAVLLSYYSDSKWNLTELPLNDKSEI